MVPFDQEINIGLPAKVKVKVKLRFLAPSAGIAEVAKC